MPWYPLQGKLPQWDCDLPLVRDEFPQVHHESEESLDSFLVRWSWHVHYGSDFLWFGFTVPFPMTCPRYQTSVTESALVFVEFEVHFPELL